MINKENIHILLPGKYKPFHDGHFYMINEYLYKYPLSDITIIISSMDTPATMHLSPVTSKRFMNYIFKGIANVNIEISDDGISPIKQAYIIANTGMGHYAMGGTKIPYNERNAIHFINGINQGGKYSADGVSASLEFCNEGYKENINRYLQTYDMERFGNVPVSATELRQFLIAHDYKSFRKAYRIIISLFGETIIRDYYQNLIKQIY